jgi:hypothetical protein
MTAATAAASPTVCPSPHCTPPPPPLRPFSHASLHTHPLQATRSPAHSPPRPGSAAAAKGAVAGADGDLFAALSSKLLDGASGLPPQLYPPSRRSNWVDAAEVGTELNANRMHMM